MQCRTQSTASMQTLYMSYKEGSAETIVRMYDVTSNGNGASKGGFVYITRGGTTLYIYSGSTSSCTGTGPNIFVNSNNVGLYIKGTTTQSDFTYDGNLYDVKSGVTVTVNDIEEE